MPDFGMQLGGPAGPAFNGRLPPLPHSPSPDTPTKAQFTAPMAPPLPLGGRDGVFGPSKAPMARLHHRLRNREASFTEVMSVFALTAPRQVSANEMDAAASALPLGLSRQEARQIHRAAVDGPLRVDALIAIDKPAEAMESAARTEEFPGWGVNLINRSESALSKGLVQHDHQGTGKVQPQAFRMILMRTEGYMPP